MKHFPLFLDTTGRRILLSGGGDAAVAKLRLLLKTEALVEVFSDDPVNEILLWAAEGSITLHHRALTSEDLAGAMLVYAADEDAARDAATAALARTAGVLHNIVDDLHGSAFITPAIVDRDPVTVAIGTEGAAPVLARAIKADLEARLPVRLGTLARIGKAFRNMAEALPMGRRRRDFWSEYYFDVGPRAHETGGEDGAARVLDDLLVRHLDAAPRPGHVDFVGAGPGDPELLTLKARRALDAADVVIHDRLISPEILELARREATLIDAGKEGFGPSMSQQRINALILAHAGSGAHVVRLKSGDSGLFGRLDEELEAVEEAGISWRIVPGITSAVAAAASIGQSLTRRGRNSSVRFITGHDMQGFAEHDWRTLARPGEVAAIYMGRRSARFVQGRLMMHGAVGTTPVTLIENASRPDERIIGCCLNDFTRAVTELTGPAIILYGLSPRRAVQLLEDYKEARP
ncbi:uroporphyrin-III methyltransferase [Haematobacter missouriensis]|uniref:Uroporphyrinogen-III C-methyltransferase n=1 Tax=Haematobacter missouriensis TaxID=366616 RepID=A0A212ATX0_9RHOB|nr:siroheme synthase CysG [Haematobacter missouriensis]KFI33232.1 uroporphyrin-III methyltransferase [Haematobacter missouriensis]OWJ75740.1 uroporphyrinogen-III C-methyltransferase [Haematobacter missouriensis]OWJ84929.1 uroporphyrinogen-III C-methyltransferase [Haematobacter missouriensis]